MDRMLFFGSDSPHMFLPKKHSFYVLLTSEKLAVAEWLPAFNSQRRPIERRGIMWVPYTASACSYAHWKREPGSHEIWRSLL